MTSITEVINEFDSCISASAQDSIAAIERTFALIQSRHGYDVAIKALATAFLTAEQRRRFLDNTDAGSIFQR